MKKSLLPFLAVICLAQAGCGGSDRTVARTTLPVATVESSPSTDTETPRAQVPAAAQTSSSSFGSGVARTYQQERQRLRLLALEQKRTKKKAHNTKSSGFFSSLLGTGSARNSSARYRRGRNGNNISSLNGLFGRRKGRRR